MGRVTDFTYRYSYLVNCDLLELIIIRTCIVIQYKYTTCCKGV